MIKNLIRISGLSQNAQAVTITGPWLTTDGQQRSTSTQTSPAAMESSMRFSHHVSHNEASCFLIIISSTNLAPDIGSDCIIQNMTYMIDTSGSMGFSKPYWLPISLQLVDFFNDAKVKLGDYTLIDYVPTASVKV